MEKLSVEMKHNRQEANSERSKLLDLPQEILSLILVKLPVDTLSILKCVNTHLSRFISSPEFIRAHLKFSTENVSTRTIQVIYSEFWECSAFKKTTIQSLWWEYPVKSVDLEYPVVEMPLDVRIVGAWNGLVVLFMNKEHLYIWNPTIKKHKKLPSLAGYKNLDWGMYRKTRLFCGFGYDACNDDYKVVALFASGCKDYNSTSDTNVVYSGNVFSLKRNSWNQIPEFAARQFTDFSGTFASGNIHWCTVDGDIVSFDVEREVFGTLDHPNYAEGFSFGWFLLCVLGGSITVSCNYEDHVDVWVMKEYGTVASWTKMFTISLSDEDEVSWEPFYILPNGEILTAGGSFDIYDPNQKSWLPTEICYNDDTVMYVESLVSPGRN